jgi:hypothetical protein
MKTYLLTLILTIVLLASTYSSGLSQAAYPDSLPLIFISNTDTTNNFYTRYGSAYGVLFRYRETFKQLRSKGAIEDSSFIKAENRFTNLYSRPLSIMSGFNKFTEIEQSLLGPESKIRQSVSKELAESSDTLPNYYEALYQRLNFWKQDETVQTFSNVFDPNYIANPVNEVSDSFYYFQTFREDSTLNTNVKFKLPISFDRASLEPPTGYKLLAVYYSGGGAGEYCFGITYKAALSESLKEEQFKKQLESPAFSLGVSTSLSANNRKLISSSFYKHPSKYFGVKLKFSSLAQDNKINNLAESYSVALPGLNIIFAFSIRTNGSQSQEQTEVAFAKWEGITKFILDSIVFTTNE